MNPHYNPNEDGISSEISFAPLEPNGTIMADKEIVVDENRKVEHTFGPNVSVFDAILNNDKIGEPVVGKWYWKRNDVYVKLRSLEADELKRISDRNTRTRRIARTSQIHTDLDVENYNIDVVATACIDPDFNDPNIRAQLAKKFSCQPDHKTLIKKIWLPGDIANMVMKVMDLSGFVDEEENISALKD